MIALILHYISSSGYHPPIVILLSFVNELYARIAKVVTIFIVWLCCIGLEQAWFMSGSFHTRNVSLLMQWFLSTFCLAYFVTNWSYDVTFFVNFDVKALGPNYISTWNSNSPVTMICSTWLFITPLTSPELYIQSLIMIRWTHTMGSTSLSFS